MTACLWPAALVLAVSALVWGVRDIAIRWLDHRKAEQRHNADMEQRFADKMTAVGRELLKQLRDETDASHKLVQDTVNWMITRDGGKQPAHIPGHIQASIDDRKRRREAAQGRNAT